MRCSKKIILLSILALVAVILTGCYSVDLPSKVNCRDPYIYTEDKTTCCLDKDADSVCDDQKNRRPQIGEFDAIITPPQPKDICEDGFCEEEYEIDKLKYNLVKNFWTSNREWTSDPKTKVTYHIYGDKTIVIGEVRDTTFTFDHFLAQNFFEPKKEFNATHHFFDDKTIELSTLPITDTRQFWINDNEYETLHSINFKCSSNLFVRLFPHSNVNVNEKTLNGTVELLKKGLDSASKALLFKIYTLSKECPLINRYTTSIYSIQNQLQEKLGIYFPYEVQAHGDGTISHTTINDEVEYDSEEIAKVESTYRKVIIDDISQKMHGTQTDIVDTIKNHKDTTKSMVQRSTTLTKNKRNFVKLETHEIDTVDIQQNIDESTIETIQGQVHGFNIYSKRGNGRIANRTEIKLHIIHKISTFCGERLIISIYGKKLTYPTDRYDRSVLNTILNNNKEGLLTETQKINSICEENAK